MGSSRLVVRIRHAGPLSHQHTQNTNVIMKAFFRDYFGPVIYCYFVRRDYGPMAINFPDFSGSLFQTFCSGNGERVLFWNTTDSGNLCVVELVELLRFAQLLRPPKTDG